MRRFALIAAFLIVAPLCACAQGITYNQVITWSGQSSTDTVAPSDIIRDVNQTGAWVSACINDGGNTSTAELEGSYDKTHWFAISTVATIGNSGITGISCTGFTAGGYYPFTRLNVLTLSGSVGTPTVTANYSASFTPLLSQGIMRYGSQPQPVSPLSSSSTYIADALKSTAASLTTAGAAALTSVTVSNPNASAVYLMVMVNSTAVPTSGAGYIFPVAASATSSVSFTVPVTVTNNSTTPYIACSSSASSLSDPSTGCFVSVTFEALPTINTQVNAAGTVLNSTIDHTPWHN